MLELAINVKDCNNLSWDVLKESCIHRMSCIWGSSCICRMFCFLGDIYGKVTARVAVYYNLDTMGLLGTSHDGPFLDIPQTCDKVVHLTKPTQQRCVTAASALVVLAISL